MDRIRPQGLPPSDATIPDKYPHMEGTIMGNIVGWLFKAAKSKTMIFSALLVMAGALQENFHFASDYLDQDTYGVLTIIIGAVVAVLRTVTHQPLHEK